MSRVVSLVFPPQGSATALVLATSMISLIAMASAARIWPGTMAHDLLALGGLALASSALVAAMVAGLAVWLASNRNAAKASPPRGEVGPAVERAESDRAVASPTAAEVAEAGEPKSIDGSPSRVRPEEGAAVMLAMAAELRRGEEAEVARVARALAVGEFAALIAHEIRQPISAIMLNCGAASNYLSRDKLCIGDAREAIHRIRRDAERAEAVIQGIRALLSHQQTDHGDVDLNLVMEEALAFAAEDLRRANVTVLTELSRDLPAVRGNRGQLQQVMLNLISNAIEAMRSTPPLKRVLVVRTGLLDGREPIVTVRDTGTGLDAEASDRLFDPLYTTRTGGVGLGLSISRTIIEAHGGRLWASPAGPPGACFSFTLHADAPHETLVQAATRPAVQHAAPRAPAVKARSARAA